MKGNSFLKGDKIYLRVLEETDATSEYLTWLNNYEVTKYTESRFFPNSLESLKNYIKNVNNNSNITFAIVDEKTDKHIGNIKLGNINWIHRHADIGFIIGEKEFWGKGIAREAIGLIVNYAFKTLNLRKIIAGIYKNNIGSIKACEKVGFVQSHVEKEKYFFEGQYIDSIVLEIFNGQAK